MAFINPEKTKEFRNAIKKAFPAKLGWKFSIKTRNYTLIDVTILNAPIELRNLENDTAKNSKSINVRPGWDTLNAIGEEVISVIWDIINDGNFDKSDAMTDYFHVGWYTNIHIGQWDKPFEVVNVESNDNKIQTLISKAA